MRKDNEQSVRTSGAGALLRIDLRMFFQKALFFFERMCYNTNKATTEKSERGEILANIKRRKKLLIQIIAIVLPLFMILTGSICWLVERSSVNSFLEAQNAHMIFQLDQAEEAAFFLDEQVMQWFYDMVDKDPALLREPVSDDELAAYLETDQVDLLNLDRLYSASDLYKSYVAKNIYDSIDGSILRQRGNDGTDALFVMDVSEGREGTVISEYTKNGQDHLIGDTYGLKMSEHPVLKELTEKCDGKTVFERAVDYPCDGNNYIAYKPLIVNGKVRAVLGLVYNWDGFKESLQNTIIKTMLISTAGMIVVMAFILFFLYRKAVKPISNIQNGLIEYADSKDSAQIVNKMLGINSNNELGYLADTISDMALEIDHYTKENVRIAVERERAETERERAEKEAYEAKVAVMASQIRPHFMYNALTSIAMMCQIDPETAQEATITFAKYLRGNMDSLKQTKPVPFEVELEHLKKYLYIEKLRFGRKLNVEYDIQATDFKLPMLSVQPLVENAVKHGVGMKKKGGTVTVISRDTGDAYEVIVKDDGVGFDTNAPKKDDGRSHVGMENTRSRLKEMCDGTVNIESTVDVGTTATIILPKEGQNNEDTVS